MGVVILIAFAFQVHVLITFWLLEAPLVGTFCIIGYIKGVVDRVNLQVTEVNFVLWPINYSAS